MATRIHQDCYFDERVADCRAAEIVDHGWQFVRSFGEPGCYIEYAWGESYFMCLKGLFTNAQ